MVKNFLLFFIEHNILATIFYKFLYLSIIGSCVGILILFIRKILEKKISGKWKCYLWYIFILALLIPFKYEIEVKNNEYISNFNENIEVIEQIENIPLAISNTSFEEESSDVVYENNTENEEKEVIENNKNNSIEENTLNLKNIVLIVVVPSIWLISVLAFMSSSIRSYFKFQKNIEKCDDVIINDILRKSLKTLKINRNIKLYFHKDNIIPSLYGIYKPKILVSKSILEHSDDEINYVFMHELSHYKRKDTLFNFISILTLILHFYNPIVWIMHKKIRADIELATDEYVLKYIDYKEAKQYGYTLLNFLKISNDSKEYAVSYLCLSDNIKNMEKRIKMIKNPIKNKFFWCIVIILIMLGISSVIFIKTKNKETIIDKIEENVSLLSDNYEHLWSEPLEAQSYEELAEKTHEYYEGPKDPTEEEMKNFISEEKAKEIARNILDKTGHEKEKIAKTEVKKNMYKQGDNFYRVFTNEGVEIVLIAETGKFYAIFSTQYIKKDYNAKEVNEEEAKKYIEDFYNSCDFITYKDFKIGRLRYGLFAEGTKYKKMWEAVFNEEFENGILNNYNTVNFTFEIVNEKVMIHYMGSSERLLQENFIIENNDIKISKEQAIEIAKKEDQTFSGKKIVSAITNLTNERINYYVWLEKNPEKKKEQTASYVDEYGNNVMYSKFYYDKYYIRNIYEVKLRYELEKEQVLTDANYGRVYYVDVTTGEILGGRDYGYSGRESDVITKSKYLYNKDYSNKIISEIKYYDKLTNEFIGEYHYELPEDMKKEFVNLVDEDI